MTRHGLAGTRIRERRMAAGLRQADLARACGISASYLNLIEFNRRRIGGKLLVDLARHLGVEPAALSEGAGAAQLQSLAEAAGALPRAEAEVARAEEFVGRFPGWAALVTGQAERISQLERTVETLSDRLTHDPYLSASLHDVLSKVTSIRSTSAILSEDPDLPVDWRARFHRNLLEDSQQLAETSQALVGYLDAGSDTSRDMQTPQDEIDSWLVGHGFHFRELEAGEGAEDGDAVAAVAEAADAPTSAIGQAMMRSHAERYARQARMMPLSEVAALVAERGADPEAVADAFGVGLVDAIRRLASLPAEVAGGPVGLVACDGAGALTFRKEIGGFEIPRFGAGCPLWPLYRALRQPLSPIRETVEMPSVPALRFSCFAVAEPTGRPRAGAPMLIEAVMLVQPVHAADGGDAATGVGPTCRICPREDCAARREPSILSEAAVGSDV